MIILSIINSIIGGFGTIFRKKSLELSNFTIYGFGVFANVVSMIVIFILWMLGYFDQILVTKEFLIGLCCLMVTFLLKTPLSQSIYKTEKISVVTPYENLNKVFTIIASYFIFNDVSKISFFITLFAIVILILFSVDLKTKTYPKNLLKIFFWQMVLTVDSLIVGYLLSVSNVITFYILNSFILTFLFYPGIFINGDYKKIFNMPKSFYKFRIGGSILGAVSFIIGLIFIKKLGMVISILLGFLSVGVLLGMSYYFNGDKPSKKNIILTVILSVIVGIGFYFR